jgi:hypothetical protein
MGAEILHIANRQPGSGAGGTEERMASAARLSGSYSSTTASTAAERIEEVTALVLDGKSVEDIAVILGLPLKAAERHYDRACIAITVEGFRLPAEAYPEVTLAYLTRILYKCGENPDPRANKIALGAAALIAKHPTVRNQRQAQPLNYAAIRDIGGDVPLEGLLATPEEETPSGV